MTLVDHEIIAAMRHGAILIEPFNQAQLQPNSYDVKLGRWYWPLKIGAPSFSVQPHSGVYQLDRAMFANKPIDATDRGGVINLAPFQRVLCHTEERIGGTVSRKIWRKKQRRWMQYAVTTKMHAKSTVGRYGVTVCLCAGLGDVGYCDVWTMEMINLNPFYVEIPIGQCIAQIEFTKVSIPRHQYGEQAGRYASAGEPNRNWEPSAMLPRRPIIKNKLAAKQTANTVEVKS